MAYDFPNSPTNGQQINNGGAIYRYDGVKWVALAGVSAYVAKAGDTMTGALQLPGNAASALQAVPLQQVPVASSTLPAMNGTAAAGSGTDFTRSDHVHPVDTSRAAASALSSYVAKAGDTMSGGLHMGSAVASGVTDVGRHVDLYGGTYGFSVTNSQLNYNTSASASHLFYVNGAWQATIGGGGINAPSISANYLTASGNNDGIRHTAPNGGYARVNLTVTGTRFWTAGVFPSGNFCIADESAAAVRFTVEPGGNVVVAQGLYTNSFYTYYDATVAGQLMVNGAYGIRFNGATWFRFSWDGTYVKALLDGGTNVNLISDTFLYNNYCSRRNAFQIGHDYNSAWYRGAHDGSTWFYAPISYTAACDERTKTDTAPTKVDALDIVRRVPVEEWTTKPEVIRWFQQGKDRETRKRLADDAHVRIGITAQRAAEVSPDLAFIAEQKPIEGKPKGSPLPRDMMQVAPLTFVPYLVRAMQQMADRIDELEARLRT